MLQMKFEPQGKDKKFEDATKEYSDIWSSEDSKITTAFKKLTGLEFKQKIITAQIYEGPSWSGNLEKPMLLRASYPHNIKIGTLIHELGHRLLVGNGLIGNINDLDSHQQLFLFLYNTWVDLYGKEFADKNVEVESARKGLYDYEKTWKWYFLLEDSKKKELLKNFLA